MVSDINRFTLHRIMNNSSRIERNSEYVDYFKQLPTTSKKEVVLNPEIKIIFYIGITKVGCTGLISELIKSKELVEAEKVNEKENDCSPYPNVYLGYDGVDASVYAGSNKEIRLGIQNIEEFKKYFFEKIDTLKLDEHFLFNSCPIRTIHSLMKIERRNEERNMYKIGSTIKEAKKLLKKHEKIESIKIRKDELIIITKELKVIVNHEPKIEMNLGKYEIIIRPSKNINDKKSLAVKISRFEGSISIFDDESEELISAYIMSTSGGVAIKGERGSEFGSICYGTETEGFYHYAKNKHYFAIALLTLQLINQPDLPGTAPFYDWPTIWYSNELQNERRPNNYCARCRSFNCRHLEKEPVLIDEENNNNEEEINHREIPSNVEAMFFMMKKEGEKQ